MKKAIVLIVMVVLMMISCSSGQPDIKIKSPKFVGKRDGAIFLLIVNDGTGSDHLTGASIREWGGAKVEVHNIVGGVMKEVEEVEIPKDSVIALKKGSYHVMVFGAPSQGPKEATLTLHFKKSGSIDVPFSAE
ncbi:MAG: copper chaperone PCu(A)C [Nitrospirota bacterium]|nr:MAG: copper chaperone PCu(A)C [Nitrospirota bacterium]